MIDSGGLMPLAMGAQVSITDGKLSVVDGPFVEAKEVIGGYAIFELRRQGRGGGAGGRVHAAPQGSHAGLGRHLRGPRRSRRRSGKRPARSMSADRLLRRRSPAPSAAMTAADIHRTHPRGLADRAAAADHQPVADAARRAAGRGPDAGSAAGGPRALARRGRSGKARRLADGDRQAPGARSSAPRAGCSRASTRWSRGTWSRSSRPCPISTPRSTTISATNCCG